MIVQGAIVFYASFRAKNASTPTNLTLLTLNFTKTKLYDISS